MKVSFVGAGKVGSTSAFSVLMSLDLDEIVLLDIHKELTKGEALDLQHAAKVMGKNTKVVGTTNYQKLKGSEVVVISAGKPRRPDMDRQDLLFDNLKIVKNVVRKVVEVNPEGIILQVTNPVDILTYVVYKVSGLPRNKVFGMSGVLDTARLQALGFEGMILGEHGDRMVPTVKLNKEEFKEVKYAALPVIKYKGATYYGPAAAITKMVSAIVNDSKQLMPSSCILDGEYGLHDLALGVPAVIGKNGVEEIVEIQLDETQRKMLNEAASFIKHVLSGLSI